MGYYISIFEKNSNWKIVQNVLKGNFYSDVVSFSNTTDKVNFIQENLTFLNDTNKWSDFSNFSEFLPVWEDEIHFTFLKDLEDLQGVLGRSRDKLLRADFCAVIDTNQLTDEEFERFKNNSMTDDELMNGTFLKFYTLSASLNTEQVYTSVSFTAELDVFFTYDINNIWKENAEISVERQIFPKQWVKTDNNKWQPNLDINSPFLLDEGLDVESAQVIDNIKNVWGSSKITGVIAFFKPQKRNFKTTITRYNFNNQQWVQNMSLTLPDTIVVQGLVNSINVSNVYLYTEYITSNITQKNTYKFNNDTNPKSMFIKKYNLFQKPDTYFEKNQKYIKIFFPIEVLKNDDFISEQLYYSDILNSPDCIRIVPIGEDVFQSLDMKQIYLSPILENVSNNPYTYFQSTNNPADIDEYYIKTNISGLANLRAVSDLEVNDRIIEEMVELNDNPFEEEYDYKQYAKMFLSNVQQKVLKNSAKQSLLIKQELLDTSSYKYTIRDRMTFLLEGNFSKTSIDEGLYGKSSIRNELVLEGSNNIQSFQNTDQFLQWLSQNSQSINTEARILRRDKKLAIIGGALGIAGGAAAIGTSIAGGIGGAIATNGLKTAAAQIQGNSNKDIMKRQQLLSKADNQQGAGMTAVGSLQGLGSIMSGISSILHASDNINRQAAKLAQASSGKEEMTNIGTELDRLQVLDNPFSYELITYELPESLKQNMGAFYHKFGYNAGGVNKKPDEVLNNGLIFDYLQAEFNSIYQALNERLSPQESKIAALSIAQGVRVWHITDNNIKQVIGDYSKRNIKN